MTDPLHILGHGAVTAVGLDAAQSCAAIRAGIKRFGPIAGQLLDHEEPPIGARVSADPRLRSSDRKWLLALAARALSQCEIGADTALIWQVPEDVRAHPLATGITDAALLAELRAMLGKPLSEHSRVLRGGAAAVVEGLAIARELINSGEVPRCVIGGADSLLRKADLDALGRDQRLLGPRQAQGLVPGEGAAFVVVGPREGEGVPAIRGIGIGYEHNTVRGTEPSVGNGFVQAFEAAMQDAELAEAKIDFVAGNYNGERYDAWELSHAQTRCYRTRRERLPTLWPARSTGEMGVAGGAMAVIAAAPAIAEGYAVGPIATVQVRSEGALRGILVLG
jgi:3-oxoacyl-[acyl-carrier-protein] synthase-1